LNTAGWTTARVDVNMDRHCVSNTMSAAELERWLQSEAHRIAKPDFAWFDEAHKALVAEQERRRSGPAWIVQEFQSVAFLAHPYRQPAFGYQRDIELLTREDVEEFYAEHFSPANTIVSIAGEVNAKEVQRMAEKYFGPLPAGRKLEALRSAEPPQRAERRILAAGSSQGGLVIGFHKGAVADPSYALWDVLTPILESRMKQDLVEKGHLATRVDVGLGFPAMKYPGLLFIGVFPAPGADVGALEARVLEHLARVTREPVSAEEIVAVKSRFKGSSSNQIALHLADWQSMTGDWHNSWRHAERIQTVTAAQLQELAQLTFVASNRTVAVMPVATK
jgi:predicted Zn-dependent peptidase